MREYLYSPSNRTSPAGQIIFYSFTLLVIPFFGYAYGVLTFFMPLAYFNVLISIGAALFLSVINIYGMQFCKNRSNKNLVYGTILSVSLFYISSWFTYLIIGIHGPFDYFNMTSEIFNISREYGLSNAFNFVYHNGFHNIFGFPLTGIILIATWIIEAGIIFTIPIVAIRKHSLYPFSEKQLKYYKKETVLSHFGRVASEKLLVEKLNYSVIKTLEELLGGKSHKGYSKVTLHTLPNESEHYLSVSNIFYDSKNRKSSDLILRYYRIDTNTLEEIRKTFPTKQRYF